MINKKGIFFTALALVILSLFVASYSFYSYSQDRQAVQQRVSTLNTFLSSTEQDLSRKLYISGFRTILAIEQKIINDNSYIDNTNQAFQDAFFSGSINGVQYDEVGGLLNGATLTDITNSVNDYSTEMNANVELKNPELNITQDDPWNVKLILTTELVMKDNGNLASWDKNETIIAYIPITYFEDPLYFMSTSGHVTNNITMSPYANFVTGSDTSNLTAEVTNQYYIASSTAPRFIDRLQNNMSASPEGIESLVNLANPNVPRDAAKSIVDYIFFSSNDPSKCQVTGTPVVLDNAPTNYHLNLYNVSSLCIPL